MSINTQPFVEAFKAFKRSLSEAVDFIDPNYTNSAITRQRYERVMRARAALSDRIPSAVDADPNAGIAKVFEALAPKNADEVALQEAEWRKVQARLNAGHSLEKLILEANPMRLAAIGQWIEVAPEVLASPDPEGVVAEVRELVFQRLVEAGVPEAVRAADVTRDANLVSAWRDVLSEALEGAASLSALSRVARLDPTGYAALDIEDTLSRDVEVDHQVKRLDDLRLNRDGSVALQGR